MTTSEHAELNALIAKTWDELGGRGTVADVIAHLRAILPPHLSDFLINKGLSAAVGAFLRRKVGGLPVAPEIDEHGTHAQLELLDVSEYRYVIAQHMNASRAHRARAEEYAARCFEVHQVRIDINDPYAETG